MLPIIALPLEAR